MKNIRATAMLVFEKEPDVRHYNAFYRALMWGREDVAIGTEHAEDLHRRMFPFGGSLSTGDRMIRGAAHQPPPPHQVRGLLDECFARIEQAVTAVGNGGRPDFPALARFHLEFERIHPFSDGNGRVGRLLTMAEGVRMGAGVLCLQPVHRPSYLAYLNAGDVDRLGKLLAGAMIPLK